MGPSSRECDKAVNWLTGFVPLRTSCVGWGGAWGCLWGFGGVLWGWGGHKMLPSISVCLNAEGQGEGVAGWVCVYCRGALWELWAWGGMKNGVVVVLPRLSFEIGGYILHFLTARPLYLPWRNMWEHLWSMGARVRQQWAKWGASCFWLSPQFIWAFVFAPTFSLGLRSKEVK